MFRVIYFYVNFVRIICENRKAFNISVTLFTRCLFYITFTQRLYYLYYHLTVILFLSIALILLNKSYFLQLFSFDYLRIVLHNGALRVFIHFSSHQQQIFNLLARTRPLCNNANVLEAGCCKIPALFVVIFSH